MGIEAIDTDALTRSPLAIKVVKVHSPTLMWVHLKNSQEPFQKIMEQLNHRLSNRRFCLLNPKVNDPVAIETRKGWQRGIVTKLNEDGTAQITLRDWGVSIQRTVTELYRLEGKFKQHYWEAVPCSLAYIQPAITVANWSHRAIKITRSIAEQQVRYCLLYTSPSPRDA